LIININNSSITILLLRLPPRVPLPRLLHPPDEPHHAPRPAHKVVRPRPRLRPPPPHLPPRPLRRRRLGPLPQPPHRPPPRPRRHPRARRLHAQGRPRRVLLPLVVGRRWRRRRRGGQGGRRRLHLLAQARGVGRCR